MLDEFDKPDDKYGTKMAALLAKAQTCGIETSIDVVSSTNGRFSEIMPPALKYTDYCIINEIEAGSTVNVQIRSENGIIESNMITALNKLKTLGVKKWVVIHAPECACGLDCQTGKIIKQASLSLPKNFIKGSTGAGDAFCTGVLYGAYKNKDLAESIKWGTGCAAASLSSVGATDGLGRIDEIIKLYEEMNFQEG